MANRKYDYRGEAARRADLGFCRTEGKFRGCVGGGTGKEAKAARDFYDDFAGEKKLCRSKDSGKFVKSSAKGPKTCTKRRLYTQRDWPWGDEREPGGKSAAPTWGNKKKKGKKKLRPAQMREIEARRGSKTSDNPWFLPGMVTEDVTPGFYADRYARSTKSRKAAAGKAGKTRSARVAKRKAAESKAQSAAAAKARWSVVKIEGSKDLLIAKGAKSVKIKAPSKGTKYKSGNYQGNTVLQRARAQVKDRNAADRAARSGNANSCGCW